MMDGRLISHSHSPTKEPTATDSAPLSQTLGSDICTDAREEIGSRNRTASSELRAREAARWYGVSRTEYGQYML